MNEEGTRLHNDAVKLILSFTRLVHRLDELEAQSRRLHAEREDVLMELDELAKSTLRGSELWLGALFPALSRSWSHAGDHQGMKACPPFIVSLESLSGP